MKKEQFKDMLDQMFGNDKRFTINKETVLLLRIADEFGLDGPIFDDCVKARINDIAACNTPQEEIKCVTEIIEDYVRLANICTMTKDALFRAKDSREDVFKTLEASNMAMKMFVEIMRNGSREQVDETLKKADELITGVDEILKARNEELESVNADVEHDKPKQDGQDNQ